MVNYNNDASKKLNVSTDVKLQVKEIMGKKGNSDKIDHHQEYEELKILLSGQKDDNKEFIEGFMIEYEDQYKTSEKIREKVLHYVGTDKKADDKNEKKALKNLMDDTNNDFDKEYIKRVIDGKEAVDVEPDDENNFFPPITGKDGNQAQSPEKPSFEVEKSVPPKNKDEDPKLVKLPNPIKSEETQEKPVILPYPVSVDNSVKINQTDNSVKIKELIQGVDQDGNVNVIADDGATVIIGVGAKEAAKAGKIGDEDETPAGDTSEPKKLTAKEKAEARSYGAQVADLLTDDYTNRNEQISVINIINEQVNSDNVVEFLKGYKKETFTNNFFQQMFTEYAFEEKETLMRKVATDLMKKLEAEGCTTEAEEIAIILAKGNFTKADAIALDKFTTSATENL